MGVCQFYAKRYDVVTGNFIDYKSPRAWGFALSTYDPFPADRSGTIKPDRYMTHDSLNVMEGVIEARDVYGLAQDGIRFYVLPSWWGDNPPPDMDNDYFEFYAHNTYGGYIQYQNQRYEIFGSAGNTFYKRLILSNSSVAAGVRTGCESYLTTGDNAGKYWIFAGDTFTEASARAFNNVINIAPANNVSILDGGAWYFRARRYDVANATYLDDDFKPYSFSVCSYPNWSVEGSKVEDVNRWQYLECDDVVTNVFTWVGNDLPANTNEVRFCITDSTTNNYIYFFRRAPRDGGFVYLGLDHPNIFGSRGSARNYSKRAVLSRLPISASTQTGTFWQDIITTPSGYTYPSYQLSTEKKFGAQGSDDFKALLNLSPIVNYDPFDGGGTSDTGGGEGDYTVVNDPIDIPAPPSITVSSTGLMTLYTPNVAQLKQLSDYMWANPLFDVGGWKKLFADPMQAILGLSVLPITIPQSGDGYVTVGNISTDVMMPVVTTQYVTVDCGSVRIPEYWGAYLDYAPYTRIELYLPYCGFHHVSADDIINKLVTISYNVDIVSGACCAYVKCAGSILYSFIGQCASTIPITGDNWTNMINGVMSVVNAIGSVVATGGETAPQALGEISNISSYLSMKPAIERSGSMAGAGGLLAYQKPYFIITRPRQALPANQNKYMGYPSFVTTSLGALKGYTEVESIHLENISATKEELDEIVKLLKEGVIL